VTDHGGPIDLEHAEEVTHPVGVCGHRIIGSRFLRTAVSEQVGCDDRVVPGELVEHRTPGIGAIPNAMDEQ
jgi:hypothetical protein